MCHSESTDQGPERWCKGGVFKLNWGGGGGVERRSRISPEKHTQSD